MLHYETVESRTLALLKELQSIESIKGLSLAGGTALSLYYGHRKSIDLDLFGKSFNKEVILNDLKNRFQKLEFVESPLEWGLFCFIDNIKVDFVKYDHPQLHNTLQENDIEIFSVPDIAAMKINAVLKRGNKKDFWDIRELLSYYTLEEIIAFFEKKFPSQRQLISVPQALTYFDDAEHSPDPICLKNLSWNQVKKEIKKAVQIYLS